MHRISIVGVIVVALLLAFATSNKSAPVFNGVDKFGHGVIAGSKEHRGVVVDYTFTPGKKCRDLLKKESMPEEFFVVFDSLGVEDGQVAVITVDPNTNMVLRAMVQAPAAFIDPESSPTMDQILYVKRPFDRRFETPVTADQAASLILATKTVARR